MLIGVRYSGRPFMKHSHRRTPPRHGRLFSRQAPVALPQPSPRTMSLFFSVRSLGTESLSVPPTREPCPVRGRGLASVVSKSSDPPGGQRARGDKSELKVFGSCPTTYGGFSPRAREVQLLQMKNNRAALLLLGSLEARFIYILLQSTNSLFLSVSCMFLPTSC